AQNMVVTFTIGDPSKVPQMTELPAAVIDEPTAQPADEPTVQPTEAPVDNTAAAADEPTALPVSGTAETPSGEAVRKTSPVLIAILIAAGVGIVAFTALKLIKRRK
ncbi:MAG: hypothetical protein K6G71_09775, partial [Clostridiales bacterium]|nr:hypothetical protein [Clostridiales bacterium]